MSGEETLFLCLRILRWSGLSFTKVRIIEGDLIAEDSRRNLIINAIIVGLFLYLFSTVDPASYAHAEEVYKSSTVVYPLYTKLMIILIVAFSVCGNIHNRKFVDMIRLFLRVTKNLEVEFGRLRRRKNKTGHKILLRFFLYLIFTFGINIWTDTQIKIQYERIFRVVHYFCFYYVTLFTAHFAVTMNFVRENFWLVNATLRRIVPPKGPPSVSGMAEESPNAIRRRLRVWMEAFMDLRGAEALANDLFGKQIFLTLFLAFSSVIVNAYYYISLNLYETSTFWLNVTMWTGFTQSVVIALMSTRAAEMAAKEANRINEIIFTFPVHIHNWEMYSQIRSIALFSFYYPMKFRAWIFYSLNYDCLIKVIVSSSAITAIFLQCDFLKGNVKSLKSTEIYAKI